MSTIQRMNIVWQGWPGAPGVSQVYNLVHDQADVDAWRSYFAAIQSLLPTGLTIQVPNSGDTIDDLTGAINGTWSTATTPLTVTGTGAGNYAGNAGAVEHWLTSTVVNGRRIRGRTFLVPLVSTAYDTAGSIGAGALGTFNTAANGLLGVLGSGFLIWKRPTPFAQGTSASVTSHRMPDLAVSLRSRRI